MKTTLILALALTAPVAARAEEPLLRRYPAAPGWSRQPEARQGLLLSIGLGGGSLYLSTEGPYRFGAADLDFRLGYGVSDRFQMFMDFNADAGTSYAGYGVGTWTWTVRGQTVLLGDRAGNGLNLNFGIGFGGASYDSGYDHVSSPTGFAVGGGLSYDVRITPSCAFSPEFFWTWHQVPNLPGYPADVANVYGLRLNLLWYLH